MHKTTPTSRVCRGQHKKNAVNKLLIVYGPDGSTLLVPLRAIARHDIPSLLDDLGRISNDTGDKLKFSAPDACAFITAQHMAFSAITAHANARGSAFSEIFDAWGQA